MSDRLEHCPFCGLDTHLTVSEVGAIEMYEGEEAVGESPTFAVTCSYCGANGPETLTVAGARDAWNGWREKGI